MFNVFNSICEVLKPKNLFFSMVAKNAGDEKVEIKGGEYKRIMRYYDRKWIFIIALFFAFVCGAMPMVMNVLMGNLATLITTSTDFVDAVVQLIIKMVIYIICFTVMMLIQHLVAGYSNPFFISDLRMHLYKKLMELDISYFDQNETGLLLSRLTNDCAVLNEVYITKFIMAFQNTVQAIAGIILSFVLAWRVTLAVFITYPICGFIYWYGQTYVTNLWKEFNESTADAGTKAEQVINAFRTVKSFDNEMYEAEEYRKSLDKIMAVFNKGSKIQGTEDGLIHMIIHAMILSFQYFSCWIIVRRPNWGMENGDLMSLMMSLIFSALGISTALALVEDFDRAKISAAKILQILEAPVEVDQRVGEEPQTTIKGKVEFRNVCFKYKGRAEYALKNLNFTVNPGETVALIGESGCGKSTTLQLLQRFYEIESGEILVDDVNITKWSPKYLRSQISIVPQGPVLFSMSIKDNIRYAVPDASDKDIAEAAQTGNAHPFIMTFPDNYNTMVEPSSLSGGQKQRICISRAILVGSPILLLDEATAALDTESEKLVQASLEVARKGKTAIVVAHRLATVMNADRILVFKEGHIVEEGKHDELMKKNGIYADLVKFQLQ